MFWCERCGATDPRRCLCERERIRRARQAEARSHLNEAARCIRMAHLALDLPADELDNTRLGAARRLVLDVADDLRDETACSEHAAPSHT